jgi:hypothetical protein
MNLLGPELVRGLATLVEQAEGHAVIKDRVNAIALPSLDDFRRESDLFGEGVRTPEFSSACRLR